MRPAREKSMQHRKWLLMSLALIFGAGCGPAAPTLAGGKSASHWVDALHDADPKKREEAVEKLGNVGAADPAAYPALVGALKDPSAQVRCAAVLALGKPGSAAKAAVPALEDLKEHDPDPGVRNYAAKALKNLTAGG
jgi:HEAT repeats